MIYVNSVCFISIPAFIFMFHAYMMGQHQKQNMTAYHFGENTKFNYAVKWIACC